jgi:hypothetical protein
MGVESMIMLQGKSFRFSTDGFRMPAQEFAGEIPQLVVIFFGRIEITVPATFGILSLAPMESILLSSARRLPQLMQTHPGF